MLKGMTAGKECLCGLVGDTVTAANSILLQGYRRDKHARILARRSQSTRHAVQGTSNAQPVKVDWLSFRSHEENEVITIGAELSALLAEGLNLFARWIA